MAITILGIEKSCLDYDLYFRMIKKYTSSLENDIRISFDKRLKENFGLYHFDYELKKHIIQIGIRHYNNDLEAQKYHYVATTLHEIKHALQQEKLGYSFESKKYSTNKKIKKDQSISEFYSIIEVEARIFEEQNLNAAIKYYNNQ